MTSKNNQLPSFIPSFSIDAQSGGLVSNPAGSVAIAKMERLLRNRDEANVSFLSERSLQSKRQSAVDRYYEGESKGDRVPMGPKGKLSELPMVSSPQPVHTFKKSVSAQNVSNARKIQLKDFGNSFMQINAEFIHAEIDDALTKCGLRSEEVLSKKKGPDIKGIFKSEKQKRFDGGFSKKEKEYVFAPLEDSINWLNKVFIDRKEPVQVRWREVWRSEGECTKELFMIFPNAESEWRRSQKSWTGMGEVI